MLGLPGFARLSGVAAFVSCSDLIRTLEWRQPCIKMFGKTVQVPRLTCWMGDGTYTYSGHTETPAPIPSLISDIKNLASIYTDAKFNSVLANYYRGGSDSVAWHADDEPELGHEPVIASLSFGAPRDFKVKNKSTGEVHTIRLGHGDLLIMSGRSQMDYLHCVPKTTKPVGSRVNLTFRVILD